MALDIVCIGDCITDIYFKVDDTAVHAHHSEACFLHGSKIIVKDAAFNIGGNAFNVAVGVKKLGLSTGLYTELSTTPNSQKVLSELQKNGIDEQLVHQDESNGENASVILAFDSDRTIFSYHGPKQYNLPLFDAPSILFYTSLSDGFKDIQAQIIDFSKKNQQTLIAFNPGSIQLKAGLDSFRDVLKVVDVLFVNKEEAIALVGEDKPEDLHSKLQNLGPRMTVITDNTNGSSASDGTVFETMPIEDNVAVLDKTGAGDAYTSAFLSALFYKKPLITAMEWGTKNSAGVITLVGSTHGSLTKDQLF